MRDDRAMSALQKAIKEAGTAKVLAERLGVRQSVVSMWVHRNGKVPAKRCIDVERAVGGAVTRYDLRPDVFGPAPH